MKNAVYEYFPGSNTPKGFYSYYDYIMEKKKAKRVIILKGGPGTGKSTFMKRIASHFDKKGYETEMLHCSSDPDSLDGVCIRECGFLILDGTAPHIVDPKYPGAVDEIINLGQFWDKEKIAKKKDEIINLSKVISDNFVKAYDYLSGAKNISNRICREFTYEADKSVVNEYEEKIKKEYGLKTRFEKQGTIRRAFLSAYTSLGRINYIDTYAKNASQIYEIKTDIGLDKYDFLKNIATYFSDAGYDAVCFYCPMSPDIKVEHLYIPQLKVFFTTKNMYHSLSKVEPTDEIDFSNRGKITDLSVDIYDDIEIYNILCEKACTMLSKAKKLHDELEKKYIPYMDFGKVEGMCSKVIESL